MNAPRVTAADYTDFLIATPKVASATEAARVQPDRPRAPAHDAFTRLLARLEPEPAELRDEVRPLVTWSGGLQVADDAVLDKPYAHKMGLVGPFWSGEHRRVLRGINPVAPAWADGDAVYPTDDRLADKAADPGRDKNDLFRGMPGVAKGRGLAPAYACFDAWYSGLDNLKAVRSCGWHLLTRVRGNRRVNPGRAGNRAISGCAVAAGGAVVHLEGFGLVKAFRIVARNGDTEHRVTSDPGTDDLTRLAAADRARGIEEHHRGLEQATEVERCPARPARSQRNRIGCAIRAFVRLEWHRFRSGVGWFEAKWGIIREAVRRYLADPAFRLPISPTA